MSEFEIIKNYFATQKKYRTDVRVGIGDDAAIVTPPANHELVITTDTLIAGVHFPISTSAYDIGHKALAVNLSDLAAMGSTPAWVTLALSMSEANPVWLKNFCEGFFNLANHYDVQLIGGDLTKGPLSITVQAIGFVPTKKALLRSNAKVGDLIYVTGTLGDAGLALQFLQGKVQLSAQHQKTILTKLNLPEPRVTIGEKLLDVANTAIDISDGLVADLGHILEESQVGAKMYVDAVPLSAALQSLPLNDAIDLALTAGDDYELCFTVPKDKKSELEVRLKDISCPCTCIGIIIAEPNLLLHYQNDEPYNGQLNGYQHF